MREDTMCNTSVLKVHMLGGFAIEYGDKPISFGKNNTTKALKLLQLLLYHKDIGISREKLLEELYGREEFADVANNLRVTSHRLKKMLLSVGFPEHDYITIKKGIYQWDSPMDVVIDAIEFSKLIASADTMENEDDQIATLKQACAMYTGEFLPALSGDDWALIAGLQYKKQYSLAMKKVCAYMMQKGEYEEVLKFCAPACEMYPFDEWQAIRVECYMALDRYKEAMQEYEDTAKLFFEELGIRPSQHMLDLFDHMSHRMSNRPQALDEIKKNLSEEISKSGPYYCSFPGFRDGYRVMHRVLERNGQSVFLMLLSITDGKGQPLEKEEKLEIMAQELYEAILHSLRRGDSYTRYSPSQFLVLLVGTKQENCPSIYNRIEAYYTREHPSWSKYLEYYVVSIADVKQSDSSIGFQNKSTLW
jgi:DNA-binding SARP family transcriptional activator